MKWHVATVLVFVIAALSCGTPGSAAAMARVRGSLPEYSTTPLAIDEPNPEFAWQVESGRRGWRQSAYRVMVATSPVLLKSGTPNMWDSGRLASAQSSGVRYAGKPLQSRTTYYWTARVWDEKGDATAPHTGEFETALMQPSDWSAHWIHARDPSGNGYHSQFADSVDTTKWVQIDLGERKTFRTIVLYPAQPYNWTRDVPGFGFPVRYKVEASDEPDFENPRVIADKTATDQASPGATPVTVQIGEQTARYVRLVATKLDCPEGTRPLMALAEAEVLDDKGSNIALGASVGALDSIESMGWSTNQLTDGSRFSRGPEKAAPVFRREFTLDKPIKRARAYVSGLGYYELRINGKRIGDRVLDPANTNFDKRVYYSVYDVKDMLTRGANCVAATLGQGWWTGEPRLLVHIEVTLTDGTTTRIATDGSWRSSRGPITENSIYNGESYDARLELPGWDAAGFDDSKWAPVSVVEMPGAAISVQTIQPIRVVETLRPTSATSPKPGVWVYDLGQNIAGWCRLRVSGPAGSTVTLRHAEMLYPDGTVDQENLRSARATDTYILKGQGIETFEPHFTYHGFRYLQVEGFPGTPKLDSVMGCVVHTAFEQRGTFSCSNELLNRIQKACLWTERDNFHSIPTDCPQRDERQGWLCDAHQSAYAMLYNFDMLPAYSKFLRDIQDAQGPDGRIPDTVPHIFGTDPGDPMWAAAYPVIVWQTYLHTGDRSLLSRHYDGVRRYVEMLRREAGDSLIITRNNYGDWVAIVDTPKDLISTGAFVWVTDLLARMAGELAKPDDAATYHELSDKIKAAFNAGFLDAKTANYGNGSQTCNAFALDLGIVPDDQKQAVFANLVKDVESRNGHLSTGLVGTPCLMRVLVENGRADLAYTVATREDYPGWGFMLSKGATTIWELWSYANGPGMNSHNHPMFGFISGWYYETLAGIAPDPAHPGWEHFVVKPHVLGDLKWAEASIKTTRGTVRSSWKLTKRGIALDVTVPPNCTASVFVPKLGRQTVEITESGKPVWRENRFVNTDGIASGEDTGQWIRFEVGSGTYRWTLTTTGD